MKLAFRAAGHKAHPAPGRAMGMPAKRTPTREEMRKDEKEIGENIPEAMKGEDDEDSDWRTD